ncbi:helix-turn-helix domain-containing protein [Flammeovirga sp. SJP92]|uniref:helix-turn-helix domain-containing protein n=1 Tax=Flammeovirga sp. SJP92 TaxID=1775430 RepID=UPI00078933E1|nr:helix-turn-helix domain-containing protein [Flammeovirga sp. SJP92]KXX69811.1 hypothetical protein AVL50_13050 [Flammeovirga sp. SJP92]
MKNLQLQDRKYLQRLLEAKIYAVAQIAEVLEVSVSTIYRELKRNTHPVMRRYIATYAHKLYTARKKFAGGLKKARLLLPNKKRKEKYQLHHERRFILWRSDRKKRIQLRNKRDKFKTHFKSYAIRLGIKEVTYFDDWKLLDLLVQHLNFIKGLSKESSTYYSLKVLYQKEQKFTVWKNALLQSVKRKCV